MSWYLGEGCDACVVEDIEALTSQRFVWIRGLLTSTRVQLIRHLPSVSLPLFLSIVITTLVGALLPPAAIAARGSLIGSIPKTLATGGLSTNEGARTVTALILVASIFVASLLLGSLSGILTARLGMLLDTALERRVMRALAAPPGIAHLEDPGIADKIERVQGVGSASYRPGNAVGGLTDRARTWLSGLGAAVLLAGFSWWVALVLSAVFIWAARVTLRHYISTAQTLAGQAPAVRRSGYFRDQAFVPETGKEVRVFGLADWLLSRFNAKWFEAMQPVWQERNEQESGLRLASLAMGIAAVAAAVYVGLEALRGDIGLGELAVYLGAIQGMFAFGQGYGPGDLQLQFGLSSLDEIAALEKIGLTSSGPEGRTPSGKLPASSLHFEGVRFTYPGTDREVLSGVDLEIPSGRSTAIVGANGAGKTTLVKLLCRFYDPTGGRILVDGQPLDSFDPIYWQRRIAAIFQDFIRYELPARDNVRFGSPDADEQRLEVAARRSGALGLIEGLPHGWDTVLSRRVKNGVDISGGEWQRIALGRALLAMGSGARILILDEPTASLDARAEAELYRSFLEITKDTTTVLISHRFSTVRQADLIYVLEEGRVVEKGSHNELVALGGSYARMFRLQAARFAEEQGATE